MTDRNVQFVKDILFAFFAFSLSRKDPDGAGEVSRGLMQKGPIFSSIGPSVEVSFWSSINPKDKEKGHTSRKRLSFETIARVRRRDQ